MLPLIEKHTDTLTEQTQTKPQGTFQFKNKQMGTFSLNPPINLSEESKWLLAVAGFETTNSVFNIADQNNSSSTSTAAYLSPKGGGEAINQLNEKLELKSQNDIELHVEEVEKRGTRIKRGNTGFILAGFGHFKSEILAELKRVKHKDLEDLVYRMELSYDEIVDIFDIKHIDGSTIG